jgi:hypothetical protein
MMRFGILNKAFSISIAALSGFVMLCQVFSASWSTTIGRNNHFNHKQTRGSGWLTDPLSLFSRLGDIIRMTSRLGSLSG